MDNGIYDSETLLHDARTTNVTATGLSSALAVKLETSLSVNCELVVDTADFTTGDETYNVALHVSDAVAGTYVEVADVDIIGTETGVYKMVVSGDLVRKKVANATHAKLAWTLAGTTPILGFIGYLTKAE